jgi:hypothetical protein
MRRVVGLTLVSLGWLIGVEVTLAQEGVLKGVVTSPDGAKLSRVSVTAFRGEKTLGSSLTGTDGSYEIKTSGVLIDYISYERADFLPRVVGGPLSGGAEHRISPVLLPVNTVGATRATVLSILHARQFIELISRREVRLPSSLAIPEDFKIAMRCSEPPGTGGGGGGAGGLEGMKAAARWPREDSFFADDTAEPRQQAPKP